MLGEHPVYAVLLVTDLDGAKRFYGERLGLTLVEEDEGRLVYESGPTEIHLSLSTVGTSDRQTQVSWHVDDLHAVLDDLRKRGVRIEEYDSDDLRTNDGIADIGFAQAAWITDPFGNTLGILQHR